MDPLQVFLAVLLAIGFLLVLYTASVKYTQSQKVLFTVGGCVFMLVAVWHAGVRITYVVMSDYIDPSKADLARERVQGLQVPPAYELGGLAVYGAYWFYVQAKRVVQRVRLGREAK